jgi:drug/metabolite transporter (DMT)-like permease
VDLAAGLGLYWWNKGASLVDGGTLAVMNNALVPAGLLVNLLLWNREADLLRLGVGGLVIAASLLLTRLAMARRPALAGR